MEREIDQRVMGPGAGAGMAAVRVAKPSKFNGTRDALMVEAWIFDVESKICRELQNVYGDEQAVQARAVQIAATYLEGAALVWWLNTPIRQAQDVITWDMFVQALRTAFKPSNYIPAADAGLGAQNG